MAETGTPGQQGCGRVWHEALLPNHHHQPPAPQPVRGPLLSRCWFFSFSFSPQNHL